MTQISLPPDTRATGQGNPPADMNKVVDALTAMQATVWITPTGDTSGTADTANLLAALAALPAAGGTVRLAPGTFYITCGSVTITSKYIFIRGSGLWATTIKAVGTGDVLRIYNTDTTGIMTGGGVLDLTIDGVNAGAGSCGLHYGDMRAGELRLGVWNFSGSGSIGIHFDNQNAWTEETRGYLWLENCTQHVVFDVSGATTATNSFGYSDFDVEIIAKVNQDGVVLQNGALLYNSRFRVNANFQGNSSAQSTAVLRITGTVPAGHPNAGVGSKIHSCYLDVQAECNTAFGSNPPQTINFGSLSLNSLIGCVGIIDFAAGTLAFGTSNWTATGGVGAFLFSGVIRGDFNLCNATVGLGQFYLAAFSGAIAYGKSLLNATNGNVSVGDGDFFQQTLTQNTTINLNPAGSASPACGQRKTIVIKQAAAGGPYTVTWPSTGSPTTTSCSVVWAGGVAPTMSAGASAVDVYFLDTYDGATWYGRASQNVS